MFNSLQIFNSMVCYLDLLFLYGEFPLYTICTFNHMVVFIYSFGQLIQLVFHKSSCFLLLPVIVQQADSNIKHMKTSHPDDFKKYGAELNNIIASPDYVGKNAKDDSIEFTKEFCINGEFVKVAVRVSTRNIYYARSLYVLNPNRVKNFIAKGTLKKLDN